MTWSGPIERFTAAIDFDGTLITNAWPDHGVDMAGGAETIASLIGMGARVIIWTCRTEKQCPPGAPYSNLGFVREWVKDHGLQQFMGDSLRINENFSDIYEKFNFSESRKVFAHVYVDDRNLGGFCGWPIARPYLEEMAQIFQKQVATNGS